MLFCFAGTFMGLTFGTLPGPTATMGIALLIPLSYGMDPVTAQSMMIGCYGRNRRRAVSSILLNIPGTPSAIVTAWDGYPMMKQDRGAQAMGWRPVPGFEGCSAGEFYAFLSSVSGKAVREFFLVRSTRLCVSGPDDDLFGHGRQRVWGIIAALFGIFLSMVGVDIEWGTCGLPSAATT